MVSRREREIVITLPLPADVARRAGGRPHGRRYPPDHGAHALGPRLRAFRARHRLTQAEVAVAVDADRSAVARWERGAAVPEGLPRERLAALLDGGHWPALRAAMLGDAGGEPPDAWVRAVRCYRRGSRARHPRETVGAAVAALLDELRGVASPTALRRAYCALDGNAARRVADAAYGLRWLELVSDRQFDLKLSLAPQLPLTLLTDKADATHSTGG